MSFELTPIPVNDDILDAVASGSYYSPHSVLGAHLGDDGVTIRVVAHLADAVDIITPTGAYAATHERGGIWVAALPGKEITAYRVSVTYGDDTIVGDDPYRYLPTLGEMDTYLISEGRHEELWERLGAHVKSYTGELGDVDGYRLRRVGPQRPRRSRRRRLQRLGRHASTPCARWARRECGRSSFPASASGPRYKFEIQCPDGILASRRPTRWPAPPRCPRPPPRSSPTTSTSGPTRSGWPTRRKDRRHNGPHVHLRGPRWARWRQGWATASWPTSSSPTSSRCGFTHVEFMPLAEHPFGGSWGYQVTGYYAPTSRYGTPDDFRYLVDALHHGRHRRHPGLGPRPLPQGRVGPGPLRRHPAVRGPRPSARRASRLGHLRLQLRTHARCATSWSPTPCTGSRSSTSTACASTPWPPCSTWTTRARTASGSPNQFGGRENLEAIAFIQEANATAYRRTPASSWPPRSPRRGPGVTATTEYGGLGFGLKWNMGWMNDTLRYLEEEPVNRRWHHGELTFSPRLRLLRAITSCRSRHDEVVHGKGSLLSKMPGDKWQQLAGLRALYAYQWSHPGKQLLFMGQEIRPGARVERGRLPRLVAPGSGAGPCRRRSRWSSASTRSTPAPGHVGRRSHHRASSGSTPPTATTT